MKLQKVLTASLDSGAFVLDGILLWRKPAVVRLAQAVCMDTQPIWAAWAP